MESDESALGNSWGIGQLVPLLLLLLPVFQMMESREANITHVS